MAKYTGNYASPWLLMLASKPAGLFVAIRATMLSRFPKQCRVSFLFVKKEFLRAHKVSRERFGGELGVTRTGLALPFLFDGIISNDPLLLLLARSLGKCAAVAVDIVWFLVSHGTL